MALTSALVKYSSYLAKVFCSILKMKKSVLDCSGSSIKDQDVNEAQEAYCLAVEDSNTIFLTPLDR